MLWAIVHLYKTMKAIVQAKFVVCIHDVIFLCYICNPVFMFSISNWAELNMLEMNMGFSGIAWRGAQGESVFLRLKISSCFVYQLQFWPVKSDQRGDPASNALWWV